MWTRQRQSLDHTLLSLVDLGLAGVVFFAPWFMGGRHPLGQLVLVSIICGTSGAWTFRQCLAAKRRWPWCGAEPLLAAALVLIVIQLIPLPEWLLGKLSPSLGDVLPLWTTQAEGPLNLGRWSQLTLMPEATRGGLVMFMAYAMLFLVVVQRVRDEADVERLLRWIALATAGMAVIGVAQFLLSNGKFLWVYEHPFRHTGNAVKGVFINENHFAHFLALGIGPLIWWLQSSRTNSKKGRAHRHDHSESKARGLRDEVSSAASGGHRRRGKPKNLGHGWMTSKGRSTPQVEKMALAIAMGLVAFAGLLTFSRGGVIVLFLATVVCVGLYARASLLGKKSLALLAAVALLVGAALLIYGSEHLAREMASIGAGSLDEIDAGAARRKLWRADFEAFMHYPLLGTGAGSHAEVYPTYYAEYSAVEYTHAESGYVQILLENGALGAAWLLCALATVGYWCVRGLRHAGSKRITACMVAIVAGLSASAVHAVWDFVWYIPACMSLTVILAACACRLSQLVVTTNRSADAATPAPVPCRVTWAVATIMALALAVPMIQNRLAPALASPHWDRYLSAVMALKMSGDKTDDDSSVNMLLPLVEQTLQYDPDDARANLKMAGLCLRRFDLDQKSGENPLALAQIRDAALASRFPSREAQEQWLSVVIGENRRNLDKALEHVRRALQLCPLQGEGYVYLAELAFLEGGDATATQACIDQSLRVRPHDGAVLLAAGGEAALFGDIPLALRYWKAAFHQDPKYQGQIVALLAPEMSASFFLAEFEPDLSGLQRLYAHYRKIGRDDEARELATHGVKLLEQQAQSETGKSAARLWNQANGMHQFLTDGTSALRCLQNAVACAPDNFELHRSLAFQLLGQQRAEEALEQFQWCLRRKPNDEKLKAGLSTAYRLRLVGPETAAALQPSQKKSRR
jgi:tetratricopeptide (TPR) repeat protein